MHVPDHLRSRRQWIAWRRETRDGKPTKIPYRPTEPSRNAESDNPSSWDSLEEALAAENADGVGYMLTAEDRVVFVDLDHCIASGVTHPAAQKILDELGGYQERSPSGDGWHILVHADKPGTKCVTRAVPWNDGKNDGQLEMYATRRYCTFSGTGSGEIEPRQDQVNALYHSLWPEPAPTPSQPRSNGHVNLDDRALLERMFNGSNGPTIQALYQGDTSAHDGDDSKADLALCSHLAWWTKRDAPRMDSMFRNSSLMREKWDERRGDQTYGQMTVAKAIASCVGGYEPNDNSTPTATSTNEKDSGRQMGTTIRFTPSSELLAHIPPEPSWIWEGCLVRGATTLFAGKPKAGKSTLLYALAEACAKRETSFLGRTLNGGPVLYASEEGRATLAGTLPRHSEIHVLTRDTAWPKPTWQALIEATTAAATELHAVLCVIDTFAFFGALGPDAEKDAGSVQTLIDQLAPLAATGCAVILNHHHRKSGGEDGDAIRGSGAIIGAVDAFAEIERIEDAPSDHRRLIITPRWTAPPVLVVSWDAVHGHRVIGHAADRAGTSEIGWEPRIAETLPTEGDGLTLDEIAELLNADRRQWHRALATMIDTGQITRTGRGDRYAPYRHTITAVTSSRQTAETDAPGITPFQPPSAVRIRTAAGGDATAVQPSRGRMNPRTPDADAELARIQSKFGGTS